MFIFLCLCSCDWQCTIKSNCMFMCLVKNIKEKALKELVVEIVTIFAARTFLV